MQVVQRVRVLVRLQFDDAAAADVGTGLLRTLGQNWRLVEVCLNPHAVFVGARRGVVPETVAFHLTKRTGDRGETGDSRGLPVDILDVEPFLRVFALIVRVEDDVSRLFESL